MKSQTPFYYPCHNKSKLEYHWRMFGWSIWIYLILLLEISVVMGVKDVGVPSLTSKWCSEAMTGVSEVPLATKPLMIFLCTLHVGGVKTYEDVGFCMDAVKLLCLHECDRSEDDADYRACIFDADVVAAYQISEQRFLECMGAEKQCIRLQTEWKVGSGCWQQCYKRNSAQCLQGCKPVVDTSQEANGYLKCALKMNPAHETFRTCLLQRIPIIPNLPPYLRSHMSSVEKKNRNRRYLS